MANLQPGEKAPDTSFPGSEGTAGSRVPEHGGPFVAFFYPNVGTPTCANEVRAFAERAAAFDALGVTLIGISPDAPAKLARFRNRHGIGVALVSDAGLDIVKRWDLWVEKRLYGLTYMGLERSTFLVDEAGRIVAAWRKVRLAGHVEEVLAAAEAMRAQSAK